MEGKSWYLPKERRLGEEEPHRRTVARFLLLVLSLKKNGRKCGEGEKRQRRKKSLSPFRDSSARAEKEKKRTNNLPAAGALLPFTPYHSPFILNVANKKKTKKIGTVLPLFFPRKE